MDEDQLFDRLTERQRQCLRLVRDGLTTKEIAERLGASPDAIDKTIKLAMGKLGVDRRAIAARLLADHDTQRGYQKLDPQSPDLPSGRGAGDKGGPSDAQVAPPMANEERASFGHDLKVLVPPAPIHRAGDTKKGETASKPILNVLDWVCRLAGVVLMILALAYAFSIFAHHLEQVNHLRPRLSARSAALAGRS